MCGIVGCLALALEADPDQNWVHTATERITHRGPDDEGFYTDPDVALGFRRLAIIDLSPGGHQPMRSADGRYWMVYNGEIYNYVELGQELRAAGRDAAYHLGLRGPAGDVRAAGQGRGAPAARHVRVRDLGHLDPGTVLRPGPVRDQAVLLHRGRVPGARLAGRAGHAVRAARGAGPGRLRVGYPPGRAARGRAVRPGRPGAGLVLGRPARRARILRAARPSRGEPRPGQPQTSRPQTSRPQTASARPASTGRSRPAAAVRLRTQVPGQPGRAERPGPGRAPALPGLPVRAAAGRR